MAAFEEIVSYYLLFVLPWPTVFFAYAAEMDFLPLALGWLAIAVVVVYALWRFKKRLALLAWLTVWCMPATIICGSATLVPWVYAALTATSPTGCSTPLSLAICFAFNAVIVFGLATLLKQLGKYRVRA